ncbi:MAG: ATP-binding protein [Geminicoccaceae bacterium]
MSEEPADVERLRRRARRERQAREEAERLLEEKSLELYLANQDLARATRELESLVEARTQELQEALLQARAATDARSQFLAMISHEIRTPIAAVIGTLELLGDTRLDREQADLVETASGSAVHLLGIINDVLDFVRIDAGQIEIRPSAFAPADLVQGTAALLQPLAVERGLTLTVDLDADVPATVRGDAGRLRQVLLNLGSNAIKFTERGDVRLHVERWGHRLRFSVVDTGPGIPEAARPKLFREFSQLEHGLDRRFPGSGLGLAISKRLVEAMGGELDVISEIGRGSRFWFDVPLPEVAIDHGDASTAPSKAQGRGRILLAEDALTNQLVTATQLRKAGYTVDVANNGREAVEAARLQSYDLVLMDVMMPEMDGYAATRAIRELPGTVGGPPILALTAGATLEDRDRCHAAGMDDVLVKPIRRDSLLAAVARWCLPTA